MGILISKAGGFGSTVSFGHGTDLILPRQPDFTHAMSSCSRSQSPSPLTSLKRLVWYVSPKPPWLGVMEISSKNHH